MKRVPAAAVYFPEHERQWIAEQVQEVLRSGQLTLGKHGRQFEEEFATLQGTRHAVSVSSGSAALEIILRSLDISRGEVIVPTNSFFASAAAVIHAGLRPVFCDCDPATLMPSLETLQAARTGETAAVMLVHIGGAISPDLARIAAWCEHEDLILVEDAAHAHGSTWRGRMAGALGRAAAFSLYATKVMTAGEGGMITTDDDRIARLARLYRDQGKAEFESNRHVVLGGNWRMSEIHAILGRSQLRCLAGFVEHRRQIAATYEKLLSILQPLRYPVDVSGNYYKYPLLLHDGTNRDALKAGLREEWGVHLSGEVYEVPLHRQDVFQPFTRDPLPQAEDFCRRMICLPISAQMTDDQAEYVVKAMEHVLRSM